MMHRLRRSPELDVCPQGRKRPSDSRGSARKCRSGGGEAAGTPPQAACPRSVSKSSCDVASSGCVKRAVGARAKPNQGHCEGCAESSTEVTRTPVLLPCFS